MARRRVSFELSCLAGTADEALRLLYQTIGLIVAPGLAIRVSFAADLREFPHLINGFSSNFIHNFPLSPSRRPKRPDDTMLSPSAEWPYPEPNN